MDTDLLRTFFSRRVQLLHQREMTMWMYLGPSCPDRPFSVDLADTDIHMQVRRVLAHWANLNLGSSLVPLTEGVDSPRSVRSD
jgi:hypothetical protein